MPSPMMLTWPFRSLTRRTGPRLTPARTPSEVAASRIEIDANSASSGSPRKVIAAPSPVSRMMRSRGATSSSARPSAALKACFSCSCSATGFFEYSTMSRNSTLHTSVRPELSIGSFYAHARLRPAIGRDEENARSFSRGGEDHALGNAEFHLPRGEIRHHHGQPALQLLRGIRRLDAGEHGARAVPQVEGQLEKLVGAFDRLGPGDLRHFQVELVEVVDRDLVGHGLLLRCVLLRFGM